MFNRSLYDIRRFIAHSAAYDRAQIQKASDTLKTSNRDTLEGRIEFDEALHASTWHCSAYFAKRRIWREVWDAMQ